MRTRTSPKRRSAPRRLAIDPLLAALLLVSLALRLWGITDRLPDASLGAEAMHDTVVDEGDRRVTIYAWEMWHGGGNLDLNPKTGDWPGLPFYLALFTQVLYRSLYAIAHPGIGAVAFAKHFEADPSGAFLFGRALSVLVGVATVFLVAKIGERVRVRSVGLLAGLLLAVSPSHILISQRVVDPNLLSLLFVSAATLALLRYLDTGATVDVFTAGVLIGLSASSKYVPAVFLVVLIVTVLDRENRRRLASAWTQIAAGISGAVLSFVMTSPFTLLDWEVKSRDLALQRSRLLAEWVGQSSSAIALPDYLLRTLPHMLTWPLYLAALAGVVLLGRDGAKGRVVALGVVVLLLANGFLGVAQERFILPALGGFIVAASTAAVWLAERGRDAAARSGAGVHRLARAAPIAAAAIALVGCALQIVPARRALALEDSRHAARRWIDASIAPQELMAVDLYGPMVSASPGERLAVVWPFLATQAERVRPAYHLEWLDGFRYYVTSSEVGRRFESGRAHSLEAAFYDSIEARGTRVWASGQLNLSGPKIEVWRLPDSVSVTEERDRLWERETSGRTFGSRLARWAGEIAQRFVWHEDMARGEEWANRSLSLNQAAGRQLAYESLIFSQMRRERFREAETNARQALREFPAAELLHVYRAMSLSQLGDIEAARAEYRSALPLATSEESQRYVRSAIEALESSSNPPARR